MSLCITARDGHDFCCCLKARTRFCQHCQRWICRAQFDIHACYVGTPLYGREQSARRQEASA